MSCESCSGDGYTETSLRVESKSDGWRGVITDAVRRLTAPFVLESTCGACGGSGTIKRTRSRRLDELTSIQKQFLYTAQLERKKAEEGVDENGEPRGQDDTPSIDEMKQMTQGSQSPSVSQPRGGPPVSGQTDTF